MPTLVELGRKPSHVAVEADFDPWIAGLVGFLLNGVDLVANGSTFRFAELETYYHGPGHFDLFAHCDPVQLENGRWYFHRTQGQYRGGSFKGLDLAFGDGTAHFGILIRSMVAADGSVLDGPCVSVDHLLERTKAKDVATLDSMIASRKLWDATSPLHLRVSAEPRKAQVYRSSRVGLSLKKAKGKADAPKFVGRPYRFLTEPQGITKGKTHLVLTLHRLGESADEIAKITGCPKKTVERYITDFEAGKGVANFDGYIGQDLSTGDLCKLLGTWSAKHGG
ncbi:MAG: sigma-70 region 4 domain-containing protein [Planctomycetes bacterium]|nr:sigma-70 region 4 domain-containing protein [Planctomycetota bacterium]